MAGNDAPADSKPPSGPLSLDDAERLASNFTALWDDVPEPDATEPGASTAAEHAPSGAPSNGAPLEASPSSLTGGALAPEPTPAMVAIAAPMTGSLQAAPSSGAAAVHPAEEPSVELPERRSDYAPPRALAVSHRTMLGLAPPPPVQIAQSATTTPLGLASPPPSKPALHLAEQSAIGLEAIARVEPSAAARPGLDVLDRDSDPDSVPFGPKRKMGRIVFAVMGVAAVLVGAVAVRSTFMKSSDEGPAAPTRVEPPKPAEPAPTEAPTAAATAMPENASASASPPPPSAPAEETPTAAAAAPGENSAVAAASPAPGARGTSGVQLAATQTPAEPVGKSAESTKARTAQRVEDAKHATRPVRTVPAAHRARPEAQSHTPVSPPLPGAGTIVRQSPF